MGKSIRTICGFWFHQVDSQYQEVTCFILSLANKEVFTYLAPSPTKIQRQLLTLRLKFNKHLT